MQVKILGIDGLDLQIIEENIKNLPNFKFIKNNGSLTRINTVFPADSVPAWNTIFTGLDPSEHGVVRGKDYIESLEEFENNSIFNLKGKTFWDYLSNKNKKVLLLNPFLAYPPWEINGIFISGPSFIKGQIKSYPENISIKSKEVFGGYEPINKKGLIEDIETAILHTKLLWDEYKYQVNKDKFDLIFITFTTLDRIQHYTWRYYDKKDPLHEEHKILSKSIIKMLKMFDSFIGEILKSMSKDDYFVIISDHGFSQRPYNLINLNEVFRREKLLLLKDGGENKRIIILNKLRNNVIKFLSKLNLLDTVANSVKKVDKLKKFKKSSYLVDKTNSQFFVDEFFNGKKPYCGVNIGEKYKFKLNNKQKEIYINLLIDVFKKYNLPNPKWIKWNYELYRGRYVNRYPDICFELPSNLGIEFDLYGDILTQSVTHYKISGGHLNDGTFGIYPFRKNLKKINSITEFYSFIISLFNDENSYSK